MPFLFKYPQEEIKPAPGPGTYKDYFQNMSVVGSLLQEEAKSNAKPEEDFRVPYYVNEHPELTKPEIDYLVKKQPNSHKQADYQLGVFRQDSQSLTRIGNDNILKQIVYSTGAVAPEMAAIEVGTYGLGTFKNLGKALELVDMLQEARTFSKVQKAAAVTKLLNTAPPKSFLRVGTEQALWGGGQEGALYASQVHSGHDVGANPNNILFGMAVGGSLGVIGKGISDLVSSGKSKQLEDFIDSTHRKVDVFGDAPNKEKIIDPETGLEVPVKEFDITENLPKSHEIDGAEIKTVKGPVIFDKKFGWLSSDSLKTIASDDPMVSDISIGLVTPMAPIYKTVNGVEIQMAPGTSVDTLYKSLYSPMADELGIKLSTDFHKVRNEGFNGTLDDYMHHVWIQGLKDKKAIDDAVFGSLEYKFIYDNWLARQPHNEKKADELAAQFLKENSEQVKILKQELLKEHAPTLEAILNNKATNKEILKPIKGSKAINTEDVSGTDIDFLNEFFNIDRKDLVNYINNLNVNKQLQQQILDEISPQINALRKELKNKAQTVKEKHLDTLEKEHRKELDNLFEKYTKEHYKTNGNILSESVLKVSNYYRDMLKYAKGAGVPEVAHLLENRLYFSRKWNHDAIEKLSERELSDRLYDAIISDPWHVRHGDLSAAREIADAAAKDIKGRSFDRHLDDYHFFIPNKIPKSSSFMSRSLQMDDSKVADLLDTHTMGNVNAYKYWNGKQIALRNVFKDLQHVPYDELTKAFQEKYVNKIDSSVATTSELNALNTMFKDAMGLLGYAESGKGMTWGTGIKTASRGLVTASSIAMLGGAAKAAAVDTVAPLIFQKFYSRVFLKNFVPYTAGILKQMILKRESKNPMIQSAIMSGNLLDTLHVHKGLEEYSGATNKLENIYSKSMGFAMLLNGVRFVSALAEINTFSAMATEIWKAGSKGLTANAAKKFTRLGISPEDLKAIHLQMDKHAEKDALGYITDLHLDKWDDQSLRYKFQGASRTNVESLLVQSNTSHQPAFAKSNSAAAMIMLQFQRPALIIYSTLLRHGLDGNKARLAALTLASLGLKMSLDIMQDKASSELTGKQPKYDIHNEDNMYNLFVANLKYTAALGIPTDLISRAMTFAGYSELGSDYVAPSAASWAAHQIPVVSYLDELSQVASSIHNNGLTNPSTLNKAEKLVPLHSLFGLHEGLDALKENIGE